MGVLLKMLAIVLGVAALVPGHAAPTDRVTRTVVVTSSGYLGSLKVAACECLLLKYVLPANTTVSTTMTFGNWVNGQTTSIYASYVHDEDRCLTTGAECEGCSFPGGCYQAPQSTNSYPSYDHAFVAYEYYARDCEAAGSADLDIVGQAEFVPRAQTGQGRRWHAAFCQGMPCAACMQAGCTYCEGATSGEGCTSSSDGPFSCNRADPTDLTGSAIVDASFCPATSPLGPFAVASPDGCGAPPAPPPPPSPPPTPPTPSAPPPPRSPPPPVPSMPCLVNCEIPSDAPRAHAPAAALAAAAAVFACLLA